MTFLSRRINRKFKLLLLAILSIVFIVSACHQPTTQNSTAETATTTECRVIKHRRGEACVPLEPKRIVALDVPAILDPLIALDLKPVGTVVDYFGDGQDWSGNRYFPALLPELVEGIEIVGVEPTPSVEKILQLKPDLILMADQFEPAYEQLSQVAPCVLIDIWKDKIPVEENFRYIAQIVGREKEGEEILNQYRKRIEIFKEKLGDRFLDLEISTLGYHNNQFLIPSKLASYFQVFQDLNLSVKPILLETQEWRYISDEVIDDFDADIVFFIKHNDSSKPLQENPLVKSLNAVKNNQAYIVDGVAWEFYGPIGMNLFLDDLAKYLLEGKQDPYFKKS